MSRYLCLLLLLTILGGCQPKYDYDENPEPIEICKPEKPVKLALVLGAGGARGLSHVGALQEFEDAGITVDAIIGCSAGSIVGALYADYPCAEHVRRLMEPLRKWDILDINLFKARYGLVQGYSLTKFLRRGLHSRHFCELQIPLYVVATDLIAGEAVCMSEGKIIPAVRASSSFPFVFCPKLHWGRVLVDGGVVNPVPVCIAKELGADVIVAIDLCELLPKTCPTNLFGVVSRSAEIQYCKQTEGCISGAHIIIKPEMGQVGTFDDEFNEQLYQAGRQAAREAIPEILAALEKARCGCSQDENMSSMEQYEHHTAQTEFP